MSNNVYWKDITDDMKVISDGWSWYANGKLVYWHGQESREAQGFLSKREKRDKAKLGNAE